MKCKNLLLGITFALFTTACGVAPEDTRKPAALETTKKQLTFQVEPGVVTPFPSSGGINAGKTYTLNVESFRSRLMLAFSKVKGYQYSLVRNRTLVDARAGGYAKREWKNQNDILQGYHETKMAPSTYSNVGSAAKFPVAVAFLAAIHRKGYAIHFLDQKIWTYLPAPWRAVVDNSIKWITFRDLLSHKSGLTDNGPSDVLEALKAGGSKVVTVGDSIVVNCPDAVPQMNNLAHSGYCYGVREYANINFRLAGYLLASFYDTNLRNAQANKDTNDVTIQNELGERFEELMGELVFFKVTPGIAPSCDPVNDFPLSRRSYALMYTNWWDMKPGYAPSTKDDLQAMGLSRHCRGQGGWFYSSQAMALLLGTLESTDNIIPTSWYRDMMDPQHNQFASDVRFGWAGAQSVKGTDYESKFGWKYIPNHDGSRPATAPDNRTVYGRSIIMRLPMGYHAVAIINSDGMSTSDLLNKLKDAFIQSINLQ